MSCCLLRFPSISLSITIILTGLPDYILCLYRAVVGKFKFDVLHLCENQNGFHRNRVTTSQILKIHRFFLRHSRKKSSKLHSYL